MPVNNIVNPETFKKTTVKAELPNFDAQIAQQKAQCLAQGGKWDAATNTCILPQPVKPVEQSKPIDPLQQAQNNLFQNVANPDNPLPPTPSQPVNPQTPTFTDSATGNSSGFEFNGNTYFGSPQDVNKAVTGLEARRLGQLPPQGMVTLAQQGEQARVRELLAQIGNVDPQLAAQGVKESPVDVSQALTAGAARIIPAITGGAATGAAVGAIGGPAAAGGGAVIGAVGGLVTGLTSGILSNIKNQQTGNINAAKDTLSQARTTMASLALLARRYPENAGQYVQLYNQQLSNVYAARQKVKLETQGDLNAFMNDGTDTLSEFDEFISNVNINYGQKIRGALLNSNLPLTPEELALYGQ